MRSSGPTWPLPFGSIGLEVSPAPAPAGTFTREPADHDQDNREENHIGNVRQGAPCDLKKRNAADNQSEIDEENGPPLPGRRRAPSPSIALGGKPVPAVFGGGHEMRLRVRSLDIEQTENRTQVQD